LWVYYLLPMNIQDRNFDIRVIQNTYREIQAGNVFPVTRIIPAMNDYEVFDAQASNIFHHYDPLLGENSFLPLVHEGSVFDMENGFYNMTDPTGYVFPDINGSQLFTRIPSTEFDKLNDFVNRRQPDWKIPLFQTILDWTAGLTFILIILSSAFFLLARGRFRMG